MKIHNYGTIIRTTATRLNVGFIVDDFDVVLKLVDRLMETFSREREADDDAVLSPTSEGLRPSLCQKVRLPFEDWLLSTSTRRNIDSLA